jgi:hypothetical protein
MNKSQVGRSLARSFSKYILWEGIACVGMFTAALSAVVVFFALLSRVRIGPFGADPASYEVIVSSIICLLSMGALSMLAHSISTSAQDVINAAWIALYKGTEWTTPAGENGSVKGVNIDANKLEIKFADGKKHDFPLRYLKPVNAKGFEADFSELKDDGSVDWSFYGSNSGMAITFTVIFLGLMAALVWSVMHTSGVPTWSILPGLVVLAFAIIPVGLLCSEAPFQRIDDFEFAALVSKTTWKAFDGRVGTVRWAKRKYEGNNQYSETILLSFLDGDEEWFRRGDLKPTVFEC